MPENGKCFEHSGIKSRVEILEKDDYEQWKAINKAHERVDTMKNWVIAGMTSVVIQLIVSLWNIIMR